MKSLIRKLYHQWSATQTPVILPFTISVIGVLALLLGNRAAISFSGVGGSVAIVIMGVFMLLGGVLVLLGFYQSNAFMEVLGLAISALGASIYGVGSIVNIGIPGLITGVGFMGTTLVLLSRILFIFLSARAREGEVNQ